MQTLTDRGNKKYKAGNGRTTFSLIDMIRALRGFRSPEGYVVIPNDVAEKIETEIERLYEVEETAVALADEIMQGVKVKRDHPLIIAILGEPNDAD